MHEKHIMIKVIVLRIPMHPYHPRGGGSRTRGPEGRREDLPAIHTRPSLRYVSRILKGNYDKLYKPLSRVILC